MKTLYAVVALAVVYTIFGLSSCSTQEEAKTSSATPSGRNAPSSRDQKESEKAPPAKAEAKAETKDQAKAETKGEEKAKAEKAKGDVGLLDTDKNYMILVTKEGKLITLDFDQKTKATMLEEKPAKMSDVGLGSAADVEYVTKGDKKIVTKMEFKPAKGE